MSHNKLNKIVYASLAGISIGLILFLHLSDEVWILSVILATIFTIFGIIAFYKNDEKSFNRIISIYIIGFVSIFIIRFFILFGAGLMISVPTKDFLDGSYRNLRSINYHKYMEYESNPEYYDGANQLFVFYHFNDEISTQKHEELTDFLKEHNVFLATSFVNIETKEGLDLAKKFNVNNGHTIVLKYPDGQYEKIDMEGKEFLTNARLLEFVE